MVLKALCACPAIPRLFAFFLGSNVLIDKGIVSDVAMAKASVALFNTQILATPTGSQLDACEALDREVA